MITEAGSLDPVLEFAHKPSEARHGGWRDPPPPIFRGTPHAKIRDKCFRLVFLSVSLEASLKVGLAINSKVAPIRR